MQTFAGCICGGGRGGEYCNNRAGACPPVNIMTADLCRVHTETEKETKEMGNVKAVRGVTNEWLTGSECSQRRVHARVCIPAGDVDMQGSAHYSVDCIFFAWLRLDSGAFPSQQPLRPAPLSGLHVLCSDEAPGTELDRELINGVQYIPP